MQQKILLRVAMTDDKTRAKALKTAVQFKGVNAVEIKGDHRNQIEVTGVEVDMIALINTLRKKVAFAELVSVAKVEPPKDDEKKPDGDKKPDEPKPDDEAKTDKNNEEKKPEPCCQQCCGYGVPSSYPYPYLCDPYHQIGEPVYNHDPNCRIM
ncbi:PREDICTED: uncharacterized protein LOC104744951 isoform X2 [Camelina sativa]|uniref:Uncharacterized protein LOC104744951 isoform X2 n=1 Tax=Camelina sativa TaxID=90675 RepID=A0ABM0W1K3_CAMSA|nr:PREDICTED: uncharacterized protein LOC104744951 isoform X2 [Camelina sativa]